MEEQIKLDERFDPYWIIIGQIATGWSGLENGLDQLIWELSDVELAVGACFTAQMIGPGPRAKTLISLVNFRGGKSLLIKKVSEFCVTFKRVGAKRNRYMHEDIIISEEGKVSKVEITAESGIRFEIQEFDMGKAQSLVGEMIKTAKKMKELREQIIRELPFWSTKNYRSSKTGVLRHW